MTSEETAEPWLVLDPCDANKHLVAPPTGYFYNKKIHVRSFLPSTKVKAVLFFAHGYCSHINRIWSTIPLMELLASKGIACFCHDHRGHGYSNGSKGYVPSSFDLLLDDWEDIVNAILSGNDRILELAFGKTDFLPKEMISSLSRVPYFISGMSMGGLTAQLLFQRLLESPKIPSGRIFFCPLMRLDPLPFHAITINLIRCLTVCCRKIELPMRLENEDDCESDPYVYTKSGVDRMKNDPLVYAGGMRVGTALAFFDGIEQLDLEKSSGVPTLIFHDPEDEVVPFKNAELIGGEIEPRRGKGHLFFDSKLEDVAFVADRISTWVDIQLK